MFKNHFIHSQQCIKNCLRISTSLQNDEKIDIYPRHMDENTFYAQNCKKEIYPFTLV